MQLFQVDAFTSTPFAGNPAGVCILQEHRPDCWMQQVAREVNLSETAFLLPETDSYNLRWFTPITEVSLCGHATLASAHVLWEEKLEPENKSIVFHTKSGPLRARMTGKLVEMDFPARDIQKADNNEELNLSLGISPVFTGKYSIGNGDLYLLEVESDGIIRSIRPNYQRLLSSTARAVIVTSVSSEKDYDFVSRFFAPAVGINEDPVTGSAHCYLTPYWGAKFGKNDLVGYQASERTGVIQCKWMNDRVSIGGEAVTVLKGELLA